MRDRASMPTGAGGRVMGEWPASGRLSPLRGRRPFVRVALLDLGDLAPLRVTRMMADLDPHERRRAGVLRSAALRAEYVLAHGLLRHLLSWTFQAPARSWAISADAAGRPHIVSPYLHRDVAVSLSHTRGFVAAAIARGFRIGIDAERQDPSRSQLDIADRFFAGQEAERLRALPQNRTSPEFTALWTLKEAFVKAIGKGFAQPLKSFSFDGATPARVAFHDAELGAPERWRFVSGAFDSVHVSLACELTAGGGSRLPMEAVALGGGRPLPLSRRFL
ncbi:4'-phosphopantetheinyl transferase family protein [Stappia indica]|uniref:4'-phosphopantetheinyl transferase family protein n=1 Tax=Stappia indica TaxID=538381 RepID=UPI001CD35C3D|nr:4'-phosphopantetheinyl transferase superfamily protein [Stappia indica]MCA1299050.1 4'-phosphopantetheinyl transferase superfamily protein [Stappia indica]